MKPNKSFAFSAPACVDDSKSEESFSARRDNTVPTDISATRTLATGSATPSDAIGTCTIRFGAPVQAHDKYFLQGGMTTFRVENKLFRVHDYILTCHGESAKLRTTIDARKPESTVTLEDVTAFEFETLLHFLFQGMYDDFRLSVDAWIAVLSISTRYNMHRVHSRAVREIASHSEAIDDIQKIVLAKKYNVSEWLVPALTALCLRKGPLDLSEAEQLGLETTVKLARAREELQRTSTQSTTDAETRQLVPSTSVSGANRPFTFATGGSSAAGFSTLPVAGTGILPVFGASSLPSSRTSPPFAFGGGCSSEPASSPPEKFSLEQARGAALVVKMFDLSHDLSVGSNSGRKIKRLQKGGRILAKAESTGSQLEEKTEASEEQKDDSDTERL